MRRSIVSTVAICIACSLVSTTSAVTHTWNGGNTFGPDSMANGLNWSGGVPVTGSSNLTLVFPGSSSSNNPNQNIANPLSVQSLSFTGSFHSLSGNGLALNNLGANPNISVAASTAANFNVPVSFNAPTTLTNAGQLDFNGLLSGNGPVTASGTQQINILGSGNNTYTGTFTSTSNTVVLQRNGIALAGAVQANGGFYYVNAANQFASTSDYTANAGNMFFANGNQTLRDISLTNGSSIGFNGGNVLNLTGNITSLAGANAIANNQFDQINFGGAAKTINVGGGSLTINASLVNGTFQKTGGGLLNLFSTSNSYTGTNFVTAGTLRTTPGSIGSNLVNNGVVAFANSGTLATNVITGPGSVVIEAGASVLLAAAQGYTGGTDVQLAGLIDADASTLSGNYTSSTGVNTGTVQVNQNVNGTMAASFSGGIQIRKYGVGILTIGGTNTQNGSVDLYQGGLNLTSDAALGVGTLNIGFGGPVSIEGTGTRTLSNPIFFGSGALSVVGSGNLDFTNTGAKVLNSALIHTSIGNTQIAGKFSTLAASSISVNAGSLTLGDAAIVGGFIAAGPITVNTGGNLTLKSLNFISLPDVTLAGGTLNTPNGYAIPLGAALQGNGAVTGRVASANGSTIIANGNLSIGDGTHPAGVNLDGELYTNANTVTLQDSNQSVLGSLTRIGTVSADGTLNAPKGLVVNFGRNVTGRGQIQSNNNLANAVIVNGDVSGDSFTNYIDFTGYVKGVGTFNNVAFSGTFSPGLSPALLTAGNIILTPSNVLDMELGGLLRGSQYDAFDITGVMALNGQLKLTFINAFTPSAGNQFDLINGTTTGTFNSFSFPSLNVGLYWDTSLLYSQGIVQVLAVPEPTSLAGLLVAGTLLGRRRR